MGEWDLFEVTEGSPPDTSSRARMAAPARSAAAEAIATARIGIVGTVFIAPDQRVAILGHEEARAHLAIADLVLRSNVAAPAEKLDELRAFSRRLSAELARPALERRIHLSPLEGGMLEWLHRQFRIRQAHPVRVLYTCLTCGDQRVKNPDLQALRERANDQAATMKTVGEVASLALGSPGSAFVLVGNFLHLSGGSDPDYICPSCESLEADSRPVTFCGNCKRRHDEPVLSACHCGYTFSQALAGETFWKSAEEAFTEQQRLARSRLAHQPAPGARLRHFDPYLYDGAVGLLRKLQRSARAHSPMPGQDASGRPPAPPPSTAAPPAPATVPRQVPPAPPPKPEPDRSPPPPPPAKERPAPVTVRRRVPPPPAPEAQRPSAEGGGRSGES